MVTSTFEQLYRRRMRRERRLKFERLNAECHGAWRNLPEIGWVKIPPRNRLRFDDLSGWPMGRERQGNPS